MPTSVYLLIIRLPVYINILSEGCVYGRCCQPKTSPSELGLPIERVKYINKIVPMLDLPPKNPKTKKKPL
jgi:hypothetical protein